MSRSRYRISETNAPYFLTCTVVGWLPVFTNADAAQIVLDSWAFLQKEGRITLFGYVILENHLHFIAAAKDLSDQVGDFKSYTARRIIDLLHARAAVPSLRQLAQHKDAFKIDRPYQLWQEGSHPKMIISDEMMLQKLEYTHNNPVKRGYVDDPVYWRYSSARNHAGLTGLIPVTTNWN